MADVGEAVEVMPAGATRRHLSTRQARTVEALTAAAVDELSDAGYHGLTVRNVARRAGVAPATAYTYFSSKEHLVAEVFWRRFQAQAVPSADRRRSPAGRATDVLLTFALVVADETELSAACTVALLADDPEVRDLRVQIGGEMHRRLVEAVGAEVSPEAVTALEMATTGVLLQVGTGHLGYAAVPALLADVARIVTAGGAR